MRGWFRSVVVPQRETWVAVADGSAVGFLEQLYLDLEWRGRGIGDRLVELAKQMRPIRLAMARRFYQRHGFVEGRRTRTGRAVLLAALATPLRGMRASEARPGGTAPASQGRAVPCEAGAPHRR
ncbi:N-acetyltransferase family protein [Spirillospora sp. CA-253888]